MTDYQNKYNGADDPAFLAYLVRLYNSSVEFENAKAYLRDWAHGEPVKLTTRTAVVEVAKAPAASRAGNDAAITGDAELMARLIACGCVKPDLAKLRKVDSALYESIINSDKYSKEKAAAAARVTISTVDK